MNWETARGYCWARALRILGERPIVTLLAVVLAGIALAIPACGFMFTQALGPVVPGAPVAEISAFATPGTNVADLKALSARLGGLEGVANARIVSREQAWSDLQRRSKDAPAASEARLNALPDVIVVEFAPSTAPSVAEAAAAAAAKLPRVESVQADLEWYRRLWSLSEAAGRVLWPVVLGGGLLLVAVVLGSIRLATTIDPGELRVLAQIGADRDFVRRPAVYAGATLLGMAAAAGLGVVAATQSLVGPTVRELGRAFGLEMALRFPPWPLVVAFVAASVLTGAATAFYLSGRALAESRPADQLD
jgi:cell division transport system permease protein